MSDLEDKLIKEYWISPNDLVRARQDQKKRGKSLFCSLIKLGCLTESDVFKFFADHSRIPFVRLSDYAIDGDIVSLLPENFCRKNMCVPVFKIDNVLFVAMVNPLDTELLDRIVRHTVLDIQPLISFPYAIIKALNDNFGYDDSFFQMEDFIFLPQKLCNFPLQREKERFLLTVPVEFKPDAAGLSLSFSGYISAVTVDISRDGRAIGVKAKVFIPPLVKVGLRFISLPRDIADEAVAEVVCSRIIKGGEFVMGIKLLSSAPELTAYLLRQAHRPAK